jgi:hypothetical protein
MAKSKWLIALVLFLIAVQPSFADDRAPIVGIWRLVSFEREYQATGEREYPMGKTPTGYILFLPEGRMAVVITGEGRKAPTTDQDRVGLFNSLDHDGGRVHESRLGGHGTNPFFSSHRRPAARDDGLGGPPRQPDGAGRYHV